MKSVYIHIPFCKDICSYCDFCKLKYNRDWVKKYLETLKEEVLNYYKGEKIYSIYVGGGTPTILNADELNMLFDIINIFDLSESAEFTVECNVESLTKEKLILFKKNKVNRLSMGIQTFNEKYLELLNRKHTVEQTFEIMEVANIIGFNNINLDLMYALPNQTIDMLKKDLEIFMKLNPAHISCYSLMIEPNTTLYIDKTKNIDEEIDLKMYNYIKSTLKDNNYNHYEISNFSRYGRESKHNLVYWSNEYYYGFGLGASGYLDAYRYDNSKNLTKYLDADFIDKIYKIEQKEKIQYEIMLGFRKIKGINKEAFYNKYNTHIEEFGKISKLIKEKKLIDDGKNIFISEEWLYISNEILIELL